MRTSRFRLLGCGQVASVSVESPLVDISVSRGFRSPPTMPIASGEMKEAATERQVVLRSQPGKEANEVRLAAGRQRAAALVPGSGRNRRSK